MTTSKMSQSFMDVCLDGLLKDPAPKELSLRLYEEQGDSSILKVGPAVVTEGRQGLRE